MLGFLFANVTKGDVFRYVFMPQVLPRIREFYRGGFTHLAYMIALVYRGVGILPQNHPIFARERRTHLGLRDVIAAAGAELVFDKKNIDKVAIYFLIIAGLVLLALQFVLTVGYLMMNPAMAQTMPETYGEFFATATPDDIAYNMLFTVFGVPDLFKVGGARSPFHVALHSLFQFYSIGLLVIAVIITCYYIFAVVAETAQTGVPFGKRYNHVWTPIRLVFALGLLIPIGYGLNAGQWVTLYAAKFGSDFATKGWMIFNETMTEAYLKDAEERVGTPQVPRMNDVVAFMSVALACEFIYEKLYQGDDQKKIEAYLVRDAISVPKAQISSGEDGYRAARKFYNYGDIIIRFGEFDPTLNGKNLGNVYPYCGDLIIYSSDTNEPGTDSIQQYYFGLIAHIWGENGFSIRNKSQDMAKKYIELQDVADPNAPLPVSGYKENVQKDINKQLEAEIKKAVKKQGESQLWDKDGKHISYGWAGAGIWYNKIAQLNGSLVTGVNNVPQMRAMPAVMQYIKNEKLQQDFNVPNLYSPTLADGSPVQFTSQMDEVVGNTLSKIYDYWAQEDVGKDKTTNNIFIDVVNAIFGTRGLFDMCANADTHPLAQLSILGKGLVEASIRNIVVAMGAGVVGALPIPFIGTALGAASSLLLSVATITISMGFILFYVLPFLPFLYFFFAVGAWIKGLFEAMVGVPLWALAHLRIDGEGLPGDAAMDGYYLIFEIFLRPILILFGLLASVVIFAAMVKVLNEIYYLVVTNLSGHDSDSPVFCGQGGDGSGSGSDSAIAYVRGPIDELFFTVIYAIIVYMIGLSCFKLIDLVPNNLLRYMGSRVNSYNDAQNDPAEGLLFRLSAGGSVVSNQIFGAKDSIVSGMIGTVQGGATGVTRMATPPPTPK